MIASLIANIMAVTALGITTWLSLKYNGALHSQQQAVFDRYQGIEDHSAELQREVAAAQARVSMLDQEVAAARRQTTALERDVTAERLHASAALKSMKAYAQAAREANERAAVADREKERTPKIDAVNTPQRLAGPNPQGEKAAEQTKAETAPVRDSVSEDKPLSPIATDPRQTAKDAQTTKSATPEGDAVSHDKPASPTVEKLRQYAGTKAAIFVVEHSAEAPAAAAAVSTYLSDAGWAVQTWNWMGVSGIFGVVVLVKDGSDAATDEAASTFVEQLRASAFSVTKGKWPADWRRYRGALDGPQTSDPTEAPIRIVIGAKPR